MRLVASLVLGLTLASAVPATAQTGQNVLLVVNDASAASVQIGEYYAKRRELSDRHVLRLTTVTTETIERLEYERTIEVPIAAWLARNDLQDSILFIVLTKGVPLRIAGTGGRDGTTASVDSELSLLYRQSTGASVPLLGRIDNPQFLGDRPVADAEAFTRFSSDLYLVTRLDGLSVDDVLALIDRGLAPSREGRIVLDQRSTLGDPGGDRWLLEAADRLEAAGEGDRVVLEGTRALAASSDAVLGYYSWGSNDPANRQRQAGLQFSPGAIGGMFVSTDGRTFIEPPADWAPGASLRSAGLFGSGSQSLAGDLIREGLTGVSAHVGEPFLDGTIRPQILFEAYLSGRTLAESYYLALPYLSWQTIIIGDPLVAPFLDSPMPADQLSAGIDPDTELPALFARRRLEVLGATGLPSQALKLALKADVRRVRGDLAAAETLLAEAFELEPRLTAAGMQLAALHEQRGEWDLAITRYRQVVSAAPTQAVALNNLAFALAVKKDAPQEALPFAQRAARASSSMPQIQDTLGWIHHLLGDDRAAAPLLESAARALPDDLEVLIHTAIVHAALGALNTARRELDAIQRLDPAVRERPDVKALRAKIGG